MIRRMTSLSMVSVFTWLISGCEFSQTEAPEQRQEEKSQQVVSARTAAVAWTKLWDNGTGNYALGGALAIAPNNQIYRRSVVDYHNGNWSWEKFNSNNNTWASANIYADKLVIPNTNGWFLALDRNGNVFEVSPQSTYNGIGTGKDISAHLAYYYKIDMTSSPWGGYTMSKKYFADQNWSGMNGAGVRIAVGGNNMTWAINGDNLYQMTSSSSWTLRSGTQATEVAITTDGTVYVLSKDPFGSSGFWVKKWMGGNTWATVNGAGKAIAAGNGKSLGIVAQDGTLYFSTDPPML